jgi:hypothetical protein
MTKTDRHVVYWLENGVPRGQEVADLKELLTLSESKRKLRREGANITNVTSSSEYVDCVSLQGVDVTGPDYDWRKRRP